MERLRDDDGVLVEVHVRLHEPPSELLGLGEQVVLDDIARVPGKCRQEALAVLEVERRPGLDSLS
jgi:hypothetical protein